jgi:hypothetical protein
VGKLSTDIQTAQTAHEQLSQAINDKNAEIDQKYEDFTRKYEAMRAHLREMWNEGVGDGYARAGRFPLYDEL